MAWCLFNECNVSRGIFVKEESFGIHTYII